MHGTRRCIYRVGEPVKNAWAKKENEIARENQERIEWMHPEVAMFSTLLKWVEDGKSGRKCDGTRCAH